MHAVFLVSDKVAATVFRRQALRLLLWCNSKATATPGARGWRRGGFCLCGPEGSGLIELAARRIVRSHAVPQAPVLSGRTAVVKLAVLLPVRCLVDRYGSCAMKTDKSLSLRENADTTRRVSAPPARFSDRNGQGGMKKQRPLASRDRRHDKARICATRPSHSQAGANRLVLHWG